MYLSCYYDNNHSLDVMMSISTVLQRFKDHYKLIHFIICDNFQMVCLK